MEPSILSLLPPVVAIGLAIATRRILLSLGIGIVLGALMYTQWDVVASVSLIAEVAGGLIIAEGAIAEEMYILVFVVLLGVLTSFIYISGGLLAFSEWAIMKVRTHTSNSTRWCMAQTSCKSAPRAVAPGVRTQPRRQIRSIFSFVDTFA